MDNGPSAQPAIVGTLDRARNLHDQLAQLCVEAAAIADRVGGTPPPNPEKQTIATSRAYSDSLSDTFLAIHDGTELELSKLREILNRIAMQV